MEKHTEKGNRVLTMAVGLMLGGVISMISSVLLLLIFAAVISCGLIPQSWEPRLAVAAAVAGALIGGRAAAGRWGEKRLIAGVLSGVIFFLMLMAVALMFFSACDPVGNGAAILASCLCGGGLAGALSREKRKGKRRRRS